MHRVGTCCQTLASAASEYAAWLELLAKVQQQYLAAPDRMPQLVNASTLASDTKKVAQWDVGSRAVHIIGKRRRELSGKFDDIFVLLMKGLVFKFQGSTEPGPGRRRVASGRGMFSTHVHTT